MSKIPSGDYTLISLSEGAEVAYRDTKVAAVLAQAGKAVHIVAGDHLNMKLEVLNTDTLRLPQASN